MANEFSMGFESPGFDKLLGKFDDLTRKEQLAIVKGSKLGKMMQDTGKKGKKAGDSMTDGMKKFALQMAGTLTVTSLLQKGIAGMRQEYERFINQAKRSREIGLSVKQAAGGLIRNNADIDPKLLSRILNFSREQGAKIGPGGEARVINAFETVRSALGPSATEQEQFSAIRRGVRGAKIDQRVDIAQAAIANIRLQKGLGVDEARAGSTALAFGKFAGGDINQFIPQLGKLTALTQAKGFSGDINDVLALEGFLSQKLALSPEEATTATTGTLGRLSLQAPKFKGKPLEFKAKDTLDQLIELFQRAESGEFGMDKRRILAESGLEGRLAAPVVGAVTGNLAELQAARRGIRRFNQPGAPDLLVQQERLLSQRDRAENVVLGTSGFEETQTGGDPELRARARSSKELESLMTLLGRGDPFGLSKFFHTISQADIPATRRRAGEVSANQAVVEMFFPPTTQQKEARQQFDKFIKETRGEGPSFQDWVEELKKLNSNVESSIKGNEAKISPEGE